MTNQNTNNLAAVVRLSANELRWLINQLEGRSKDYKIRDHALTGKLVLKALESEEARVTAAIDSYVRDKWKVKSHTSEELKQIHDDREK